MFAVVYGIMMLRVWNANLRRAIYQTCGEVGIRKVIFLEPGVSSGSGVEHRTKIKRSE